jgi:uncharacterized protein YeaO (DUF488 family)
MTMPRASALYAWGTFETTMLKTKCVRSPIDLDDGLRILATRFRGRGLTSDRYDVWMPNLGPSEKLLKRFLAGEIPWNRYSKLYQEELFLDGGVDADNRTIKNHGQKFILRLLKRLAEEQSVTLLCHCAEAEQHCNRHVLQKLILSRILNPPVSQKTALICSLRNHKPLLAKKSHGSRNQMDRKRIGEA